jgi:hypothetical protein
MIKLNRDFVNEWKSKALWMSRNRRFVNDQAKSKTLWMNRNRRFYEWVVSKPKIYELSSWIEVKILWMNRVKIDNFLLRISRSRSSKNDIDWRDLFRGFQDRDRKKTIELEFLKNEYWQRIEGLTRVLDQQEWVLTVKSDQKEVLYSKIWSDRDLHDKI